MRLDSNENIPNYKESSEQKSYNLPSKKGNSSNKREVQSPLIQPFFWVLHLTDTTSWAPHLHLLRIYITYLAALFNRAALYFYLYQFYLSIALSSSKSKSPSWLLVRALKLFLLEFIHFASMEGLGSPFIYLFSIVVVILVE